MTVSKRNRVDSWGRLEAVAYPKIRSGWAMKSVIRSSMLRGSSTKVGKVTLDRSIPTLQDRQGFGFCEPRMTGGNVADLNWDIMEEIIEPSFSSLKSV